MDNVNYSPEFTQYVVGTGVLHEDPFVLIDVGCGMGIDPAWRVFEPDLRAHGFDPQEDEIKRLAALEENAHVHYHATLVGLPDEHEYNVARRQEAHQPYFDPINRSSSFAAMSRQTEQGQRSLEEMNSWQFERLATAKQSLSDFVSESALATCTSVN